MPSDMIATEVPERIRSANALTSLDPIEQMRAHAGCAVCPVAGWWTSGPGSLA